MTNLKLLKTWKAVETILRRAESAIPFPNGESEQEYITLKKHFNEYLDHNELELAMDMLEELSAITKCRGAFWRDMQRAAELMNLKDRENVFWLRFEEAIVHGDSAGGQIV